MNIRKEIRGQLINKSKEELFDYCYAYHTFLNYWESFDRETQNEINKELNGVFQLNTEEQVETREFEEDEDKRYCHLCGSEEEKGGWCTNETCAEYKRSETDTCEGCGEYLQSGESIIKGEDRHSACS